MANVMSEQQQHEMRKEAEQQHHQQQQQQYASSSAAVSHHQHQHQQQQVQQQQHEHHAEFPPIHSEIQRLNADTIRRISAEQAISDLASIVKELVDNSLDAESTTIKSK